MNIKLYEKFIINFNKDHSARIESINTNPNALSILESTKEELIGCKAYIHNFFSENGSASGIRHMYESVEDRAHNWKEIETCDMNRSSDLYTNYNSGMKKYLQEILTMESVDPSAITTIGKARENDSLFVKSIFGGSNNESSAENICEAVKNIECLIDFIPSIDSFIESVDDFITMLSGRETDAIAVESVKLYAKSLSDYCYETISHIVTDYDNIQNAIDPNGHKNVMVNESPSSAESVMYFL